MIKKMIKTVLPESFRRAVRKIEKRVRYFYRRLLINLPIAAGMPMKIIVGAALTYQKGWYSTNEQWLDISNAEDWSRLFKGKALLTHVLSEHVFEHLSREETRLALKLIYDHMKPGGRLRIAVPDGYNPDPVYIQHVGINGIGADASDHKQLLNKDTLTDFLEEVGFAVEMLEGYLKNGDLVQKTINASDGRILRSRSNSENMAGKAGWGFADANTSLVIDGIKLK